MVEAVADVTNYFENFHKTILKIFKTEITKIVHVNAAENFELIFNYF